MVSVNPLFVRAVLAFVALPGTVAFLVPLWLLAPRPAPRPFDPLGLLALVPGTLLLLVCVREFYRAGRGTLAPWEPPRALVATGPYRLSRNPMYLAVVLVLWGWAWGFRSRALMVYSLAVMLAFHLRVRLAEEPWLARTFGEQWLEYKRRVPRWMSFRRDRRSRE